MSPKRPSGTARRRRCSRRSSSRLAAAELLPGSNCRSQTNRVTPASTVSSSRCSRSRRSPGGTRSAMRASIRRSASTSASAQSRSIVVVAGRMVRVRRQASTNLRTRSSFDCAWGASSRKPLDELPRRAAREGPEPVQAAQLRQMLVPGLGPHRVVAELLPVQVELAADEVHDHRGNELARGQQTARVAEDAQLQREAQLVAGTPPDLDVLQVLVAQGVVAQQVRLALRKGKQGRPLPAGQDGSPCHALSLDVCETLIGTRPTIRGGTRQKPPAPSYPKRPFATHADRLRPRLEDRRLAVAGPAARRPGDGRRRRRQRLPRPRVRRPGRPAGAR